ncbi:MAG: DUF2156 domain-containing protein [Acholeplasmatales bacterium]|nr:DUF2156 domain-containing protein [Acholeplasmatales bacterium]
MTFKKITCKDLDIIKKFVSTNNYFISDLTVGAIFMWKDFYGYEICYNNDYLIIKSDDGYLFPLGDYKKGIEAIKEEKITLIPEQYIDNFKDYKLEEIDFRKDYVYNAFDLAYLEDKKYEKKLEHIKKFNKLYPNYSYEIISKDNIKDIINEYSNLTRPVEKMAIYEANMALEVLKHYDDNTFIGMLLKVDGRVIAFTVGEILFDILHVHIEKANIEYKGVYQVINNLFSKYILENYNIKYINRQDDAGFEGLRKAKKSYYPTTYYKKYFTK